MLRQRWAGHRSLAVEGLRESDVEQGDFWALIDASRVGNEHDPDAQAIELTRLLTGRSRDELQGFDRLYCEQLARAHSWDLWGVGYLVAGGMGDDSFDFFRDWLVGRGRESFEHALLDADAFGSKIDPAAELEAEELRYSVQKAYEDTHGEELPLGEGLEPEPEPTGQAWDEDEELLARRLPRTAARSTS